MDSLSERVAAFLRKAPARGHCFRCLAAALDTPQPEVREASQLLISQEGFRVRNGACYRCRRTDKLLAFNPFAHPLCALCRTPILPSAAKTIVQDLAYHAGCWDRKARGRSRPASS